MIGRAAALAAVILVGVALAVLLLGGDGTRRYELVFDDAGQLVRDDDVQVGGRRIGAVEDIELTGDARARVTVSVQEPYAPLHEGTSAVIRATSLSGVANRYVALTPGPQSSRALDDGATLRVDRTTAIVDLDQLFDTFDGRTRHSLTKVIRSLAAQYDGRGDAAGQAAHYFSPLLSTSRRLVEQLGSDEQLLTGVLVNTSRTMGALAERRDDLAGAISHTGATAGAIASESTALDRALRALPTTLRRGNSTFVDLRATLDDLDPLVAESKPATRRLAPFLRRLRPLLAQARPAVADLRTLVSRPGAANDLLDATRRMPALERAARPALRDSIKALRRSQPVLEFYRPYTPDLAGFLRDFGQGASTYDANGHYARIAPVFNVFDYSEGAAGGSGGTLTAVDPASRLDRLQKNITERCPGAATQRAADGSNATGAGLPAGACKPEQAPPGP